MTVSRQSPILMTSIWNRLAVFAGLCLFVSSAASQQVYLHVENDILAGTDGHYTGGIELGWHAGRSHMFERPAEVVWQLKFLIFTPADTRRSDPNPNDLPYAGVALLHYNLFFQRDERSYDQLGFQVGWMGPSTHLGELQQQFHRAIGNQVPKGWQYQLPDRPLAGLFYNRAFKLWQGYAPISVQAHVGGLIGNLARYVNGALLWRWGVDADRVRAFDQILGTSASEALWQGRRGWQLDMGVQWNHYAYLALVNDQGLSLNASSYKLMAQLQYSWRHWQLAFLMHQSPSIVANQKGVDRWGGLKLAYAFE